MKYQFLFFPFQIFFFGIREFKEHVKEFFFKKRTYNLGVMKVFSFRTKWGN